MKWSNIHVKVVGNDQRICDLDMGWPGKTHDSRVFRRSEFKVWLEAQDSFFCAGDSGYRISPVLMKPFSEAQANANVKKRRFNWRLSQLRTVMSEKIFGRWVRR